MKRLWAPWRLRYIQQLDKGEEDCIFCCKPGECNDRENLIVYKGECCFVIMNRYPYNNGHLMVVPYAHTASLEGLDDPTVMELFHLVRRCTRALTEGFRPDGYNIGVNLGRVAGAGIDCHVHVHIVPRWNGDTNFMPVVGETKVISQGLMDAYDLLKKYF